jgi:glyoxylase-like metal-dependent hydrolase (beta-lactamase superfamily II)
MEIKKINDELFYIADTTNIPLIKTPEGFIIFDAPIDKDKAKKVKKIIEENVIKPKFLILSHHHADHTGGASYLKEYFNLTVLTSESEKLFIENPMIEPIYLAQGANPPKEFLTKWVKSEPVKVDEVVQPGELEIGGRRIEFLDLSGHSIGMVGVKVDDVIFSADCFFSDEILKKYIVPYFHDKDKFIEKLNYIKAFEFLYILPSHGALYSRNEANSVLEENIKVVNNVEKQILTIIETPKNVEEILTSLNLPLTDFVVSYLIKSSAQSILFSLLNKGDIKTYTKNCITYFAK